MLSTCPKSLTIFRRKGKVILINSEAALLLLNTIQYASPFGLLQKSEALVDVKTKEENQQSLHKRDNVFPAGIFLIGNLDDRALYSKAISRSTSVTGASLVFFC